LHVEARRVHDPLADQVRDAQDDGGDDPSPGPGVPPPPPWARGRRAHDVDRRHARRLVLRRVLAHRFVSSSKGCPAWSRSAPRAYVKSASACRRDTSAVKASRSAWVSSKLVPAPCWNRSRARPTAASAEAAAARAARLLAIP